MGTSTTVYRRPGSSVRRSSEPTTSAALYKQRYGEAKGLISQDSNQRLKDVQQTFHNARVGLGQYAASKGLTGATTFLGPMFGGIDRNALAATNDVRDAMLDRELGVMNTYTQGQASAMDSAAQLAYQKKLAKQSNALAQQQMAQQAAIDMARVSAARSGRGYTPSRGGYSSTYSGRVNTYPGGAGSTTRAQQRIYG